jgi:hypothetical protein
MPLNFSGATLPMTLRVCRTLVWTQAAVVILGGVFVVLTVALLGSSIGIPFHDGTLSGWGAAGLGATYIGAGLVLIWLGVVLGQLARWALPAIVSMQVFLAVIDLFRSFALSTSMILDVVLYVAVLALLFAPDTRRALEGSPAA